MILLATMSCSTLLPASFNRQHPNGFIIINRVYHLFIVCHCDLITERREIYLPDNDYTKKRSELY